MPMRTTHHHSPLPGSIAGHFEAVRRDLAALEEKYGQYLEQESLSADVQCLRSWVDAQADGDAEAMSLLDEHGEALLENIKCKLQDSSREIQRLDEESPIGGQFTGGKSDRINQAARTALHAEEELSKALQHERHPCERPVVSK